MSRQAWEVSGTISYREPDFHYNDGTTRPGYQAKGEPRSVGTYIVADSMDDAVKAWKKAQEDEIRRKKAGAKEILITVTSAVLSDVTFLVAPEAKPSPTPDRRSLPHAGPGMNAPETAPEINPIPPTEAPK